MKYLRAVCVLIFYPFFAMRNRGNSSLRFTVKNNENYKNAA